MWTGPMYARLQQFFHGILHLSRILIGSWRKSRKNMNISVVSAVQDPRVRTLTLGRLLLSENPIGYQRKSQKKHENKRSFHDA